VRHEPEEVSVASPVTGKVDTQDLGLTRPQPDEAGQQPQDRGLARSVGAAEQHDLASAHVEVGARQSGEATEETDSGAEAHSERQRTLKGRETVPKV